MSTHWYLVHSKPRQEQIALQNLEQQGFSCYMPLIKVEKLRRNKLTQVQEPLFPRYLFIQLGKGIYDKSWTPIRSTTGVCNLVRFGIEPAKVDENLIAALRQHETGQGAHTQSLFSPGERLQITSGAFAGLDVIYQMTDGNNRVMVLIELLSKPVKMFLEPGELRKT
jgi:transcriptional antiterminator RfaH